MWLCNDSTDINRVEVTQVKGEVNLWSFIMNDMTGPPMATGASTTQETRKTILMKMEAFYEKKGNKQNQEKI